MSPHRTSGTDEPAQLAHCLLGLDRMIGAERQAKLPLGVVRPEGASRDGLSQQAANEALRSG